MPLSPNATSHIFSKNNQVSYQTFMSINWDKHSLGPIKDWNPVLIHFLNFIFNSKQPCFLFWSNEAFCFYNDGYIPILGNEKHPHSMGAKAVDIWKEIWTIYTEPQFKEAMSGKGTWNLDQFIPISRDGNIVEAYFTYGYSPLFLDDGTINGVLTTAVETTDKIVATDQLKLALNVTKIGFYDWNMETDHVVFNQQMQDDWGIDAGTSLQRIIENIHPEDVARVTETIKESIKNKKTYESLYRVLNPVKGIVWIEAKGHAKYKGDKAVQFLGTSLNVTESQVAKIELEKSLKVRDEFLAIASHELRTPLTSLKLLSQLQLRKKTSTESDSIFAKKIDTQLYRLTRLVDDMLDVSRIQTGQLHFKMEDLGIVKLTQDTVESFSSQLSSLGYEIPVIEAEKEIIVNVDRLRIEQVITNILSNAVRYGNKKPISIKIHQEKNSVRISITDLGIGMEESILKKIFGRFERGFTSSEISGLGLGLYISQEIIQAHSGSIQVISSPGKGSTFTINLPVHNS